MEHAEEYRLLELSQQDELSDAPDGLHLLMGHPLSFCHRDHSVPPLRLSTRMALEIRTNIDNLCDNPELVQLFCARSNVSLGL